MCISNVYYCCTGKDSLVNPPGRLLQKWYFIMQMSVQEEDVYEARYPTRGTEIAGSWSNALKHIPEEHD